MLVVLYLAAIVAANLSVSAFGPEVSVINAFLFIGLDLSTRDALHERWHGRALWPRMLLLIGAGSALSAALNINAAQIAIASFAAFLSAGVADALVYSMLGKRSRLLRMNGSNLVAAGVDSLVFPALAFGLPVLWPIALGQFVAKVGGGFIWSLLLTRYQLFMFTQEKLAS